MFQVPYPCPTPYQSFASSDQSTGTVTSSEGSLVSPSKDPWLPAATSTPVSSPDEKPQVFLEAPTPSDNLEPPAKRRKMHRYSKEQECCLNSAFTCIPYPSRQFKENLGEKLNLPYPEVQVPWFEPYLEENGHLLGNESHWVFFLFSLAVLVYAPTQCHLQTAEQETPNSSEGGTTHR